MDPYTWVMIAVIILSIVLAPKPESPKPASLTDFEVPTADNSRAIPVVFGTVMVSGPNVVWYGDLNTQAIYSEGGKK